MGCLQSLKFDRVKAVLKRVRLPRFRAIFDDERGAVAVLFAFILPIILGAAGLAVEASYWQLHQRAMQNAADSAAIAAGMEGGTNNLGQPATNYVAVAQAVAAQYGFVNGSGNVTVTVSNPASATGCTSNCYSVSISDKVPLFLSAVVGYQGTTSVNSKPMTSVLAGAVATQTGGAPFCLLALAGSGAAGITSNGAPKANMNGCNVMSNTSATCNGHNLNATYGEAHGADNGCGNTQISNVPTVADPYAGLASNIPAEAARTRRSRPRRRIPPFPPPTNGPERIPCLPAPKWSAGTSSSPATPRSTTPLWSLRTASSAPTATPSPAPG